MAVDTTVFWSGLLVSANIFGTDAGAPGKAFSITTSIETADLVSGTTRTPHATLHRNVKYQFNIPLAEYAFRNLALTLAQPVANVGSSGSYLLGTNATSDSGIVIVKANNEQQSKYHNWIFPNAKIASGGTVNYDTENQGFLDLTFDANADSNGHPFQLTLTTS